MPSIIEFHDCDASIGVDLTYVIIGARYREKWVFVKSRKRGNYELPAGHIIENELPEDAAVRELKEETGAVRFSIECVNIYSVTEGSETGWGKLFFAEIYDLVEIIDKNEIRIFLCQHLELGFTFLYLFFCFLPFSYISNDAKNRRFSFIFY